MQNKNKNKVTSVEKKYFIGFFYSEKRAIKALLKNKSSDP